MLASACLLVGLVAAQPGGAAAETPSDWLSAVNHFRAMAGVAPVQADPAGNAGVTAHSCYMLQNGISHEEIPGRPGYTTEGAAAGPRSNVATASNPNITERAFVELWITAPYHAIGVLRGAARTMAYGDCVNPDAPVYRAAASLDVLSGVSGSAPTAPTVWPGNGSRTHLTKFVAESPSPVTECGWSGGAGLPILAMMPESAHGATATVSGPAGPVEVCTLHAGNSKDATAKAILNADNGVVILPRTVLQNGSYEVTLNTPARQVKWTFTVDPTASEWGSQAVLAPETVTTAPHSDPVLSLSTATGFVPLSPTRVVDSRGGQGATRLQSGVVTPVQIGGLAPVPAGARAVSVNLTAVSPSSDGYLTAFPCGSMPGVSSVNFSAGSDTPNAAVVALDSSGRMCLYASADTDVLIDVSGALSSSGAGHFVPVSPARLVDTRLPLRSPGRLAAGSTTSASLLGPDSPLPADASAVVLNVTAVDPAGDGFVTVYPCGSSTPVVSNLNPQQGQTRPNLVVVPVSPEGSICFYTTSATDLLADITGFISTSGSSFTALVPARLADTRQSVPLSAGATLRVPVAGHRGVPGNTSAIAVNITATGTSGDGYITAYGCGTAVPNTSTLNLHAGRDTANGAQLQLGPDGDLCLYTTAATHIIIDVNGLWM